MAKSTTPIALVAWAILAWALPAAPSTAQDLERGEVLFALCDQCHGAIGEGMQMALAPPIAGLSDWYIDQQLKKFKTGARGLHPDDVGGLRMYPMSLTLRTDEDIAALAAHVSSLPPTRPELTLPPGDAQKGKARYAPCQGCHGAKAEGREPIGPSLDKTSDWYFVASMQKYRDGIRPADPKLDPTAMAMVGMARLLPDDQTVLDVYAYIRSLSE